MISLPLSIRYREQPQHVAAAWLVPGDDLSLWLEEWLRWELPQTAWQIAVLPGWGVLTILPAGQKPALSPRAVPFGCVGSRWYLPLHAELLPPAKNEELAALLPNDFALAIFHPARGLLAIEPQQLGGLHNLLAPPLLTAQDWTAAQPGEALNAWLLSVQPSALPSLDEVMQAGRDDIGTQSSEWKELSKRPHEPGNSLADRARRGLSKMAVTAIGGLAGMLSKVFSQLPAAGQGGGKRPAGGAASSTGAGGPGWLDSLANWAAKHLSAISQQLEDQRNREIQRLMHMLQNNPDEGLKFAIPFGSGEHRGIAPPGGSLGSRDVNFDLSRLGGGGPADMWNLPPKYQLQLAQRYRELANRELELGRHRRAAYIFAELLGDFAAAASALAAGEHWREAAVLYRDRLNRPRQAAECLERGGLLNEAIALYEPLRMYEKIGDLYQRLEQKDDALAAWRKAAAFHEGNRDFFQAANLFEVKIASPEEAACVLDRSWVEGHHLRESLEKLFDLFVRQGWHERARERIKALRDMYHTDTIAQASCEALATVVRTYPDSQIGDLAADTARVIIGTHLPGADKQVRSRLVIALQQLVPADQLLPRDGQRYLRERDAAQPPPPPPPKQEIARRSRSIKILREFHLAQQVTWEAAAAAGNHFFAVGNGEQRAIIVAVHWQGQGGVWTVKPNFPAGLIELPHVATDPQGHGPLLVATGFGKHEVSCEIQTPNGPARAILFENPGGTNAAETRFTRMGLCYALGRAFFIERDKATGHLIANGRLVGAKQTLGDIVTTFELCEAGPENSILPTHGRSELLAVGYESELLIARGSEEIERIEFGSPIRQIVGSAPFTRTRLAVVTDTGTQVMWVQGRDISPPTACGLDLHDTVSCFTLGGHLVLIGSNGGEIYETSNVKLTLCHTFANFTFTPIAVLPTDEPNEFGVIAPNGQVRVYQVG